MQRNVVKIKKQNEKLVKGELKYLFEKEKSKNEKKFARIGSLKTTRTTVREKNDFS